MKDKKKMPKGMPPKEPMHKMPGGHMMKDAEMMAPAAPRPKKKK